jgi:hypothetical protein
MNRISTFGLRAALAVAALVVVAPRLVHADAAGKHTAYCYTNLPQATGYKPDQPTYFSAVFQSADEGYRGLFSLYLTKKYGWSYPGPEGCSYGGDAAGVQKSHDEREAQVKASGKAVVDTGWKYTSSSAAEIAAMPQAKPPAVAPRPAPAAPAKSPQLDAYERALQAQQPSSVGQDSAKSSAPTKAAAKPTVPANPTVGRTTPSGADTTPHYVYCHAVGWPPSASRGVYYVTAVFAYVPSEHSDQAFTDFLSRQHPDQSIRIPQCSNPQVTSEAVAEGARQKEMATKRQAKANVVDTGWKPGT